jgi:hypothetical protein
VQEKDDLGISQAPHTHASFDSSDLGEWEDGKRHAGGRGTHEDKYALYEGKWKDGLRHGRGVMTCADVSVYEGGFENA